MVFWLSLCSFSFFPSLSLSYFLCHKSRAVYYDFYVYTTRKIKYCIFFHHQSTRVLRQIFHCCVLFFFTIFSVVFVVFNDFPYFDIVFWVTYLFDGLLASDFSFPDFFQIFSFFCNLFVYSSSFSTFSIGSANVRGSFLVLLISVLWALFWIFKFRQYSIMFRQYEDSGKVCWCRNCPCLL